MVKITYRYCIVCQRNRPFKYNGVLQHAECESCGSRFSETFKDGVTFRALREYARVRREEIKQSPDQSIAQSDARQQEINALLQQVSEWERSLNKGGGAHHG